MVLQVLKKASNRINEDREFRKAKSDSTKARLIIILQRAVMEEKYLFDIREILGSNNSSRHLMEENIKM